MPNVPQRSESYGELLAKQRKLSKSISDDLGTRNMATFEESKNARGGIVRVTKLPHPFKCSECDYIGDNGTDIKRHWAEVH